MIILLVNINYGITLKKERNVAGKKEMLKDLLFELWIVCFVILQFFFFSYYYYYQHQHHHHHHH